MYNNFLETGRHMSGFNGGFDSWGFGPGAFIGLSILGLILGIWFVFSIALKGYALWTAAKRNEKWWFIALLVINTMGILELVYLLFVAKVSWVRDCKECGHCKHCSEDKVEESEKMDPHNEENTRKEAEEVM